MLLLSCVLKHLLSFKKGMLGVFSVFIVMKMVCVGCELYLEKHFTFNSFSNPLKGGSENFGFKSEICDAELKEISIMLTADNTFIKQFL